MKKALPLALLCAGLCPASAEFEIGRLIAPDAWLVAGVDVERFQESPFAKLAPGHIDFLPREFDAIATGRLRQAICMQRSGDDPSPQLEIYLGDFVVSNNPLNPDEYSVDSQNGIRVVTSRAGASIALLDAKIIIRGDENNVSQAILRWRQGAVHAGIHDQVRGLAGRYDAWVLALQPLQHVDARRSLAAPPQVESLLKLVEEFRAGVRFGGATDVQAEADFTSGMDAMAAATAARWLPDWLAWQAGSGRDAAWIAAIEGFATHANGRTASLSFSIPDAKALENIERLQHVDDSR